MVDWTKPLLTDLYQDFLSFLKQRDDDLAVMFDGSTSTNLITNTIRWSDANGRFEKWNGTAWLELKNPYLINVDQVDGIHAAAVATANQLLALNNDSKLPASITGGSMSVNGFSASSTPSAGILLALDGAGKLPTDITGDASTVGGVALSGLYQEGPLVANKFTGFGTLPTGVFTPVATITIPSPGIGTWSIISGNVACQQSSTSLTNISCKLSVSAGTAAFNGPSGEVIKTTLISGTMPYDESLCGLLSVSGLGDVSVQISVKPSFVTTTSSGTGYLDTRSFK